MFSAVFEVDLNIYIYTLYLFDFFKIYVLFLIIVPTYFHLTMVRLFFLRKAK